MKTRALVLVTSLSLSLSFFIISVSIISFPFREQGSRAITRNDDRLRNVEKRVLTRCPATWLNRSLLRWTTGVLSRCLLVAPSIDSMPFCTRFMQPSLSSIYLFKLLRLCIQDESGKWVGLCKSLGWKKKKIVGENFKAFFFFFFYIWLIFLIS